MSHTLDHDGKRNGATAFLESHNVLGFLMICDSFANTRGHFWASTAPFTKATPIEERGALNKATGKAHSTIVSYRQFLKDHGALIEVERETVIKQYEMGDPSAPPKGVHVWQITGMIRPCNAAKNKDPKCDCDCLKFIQNFVAILYSDTDKKSMKIKHKGNPLKNKGNTGKSRGIPAPRSKNPDSRFQGWEEIER